MASRITKRPGSTRRNLAGLLLVYLTAATVKVTSGLARSDDDTADLALTADTTINLATAGAGGLDQVALSGTWSRASPATDQLDGTGSDAATEFGPIAMTGTITSVGTTITGVGTLFRSEVAIGDLIGSTAHPDSYFVRVTAIDSDTSLTVARDPASDSTSFNDFGGDAAFRIEQPTLGIGAEAKTLEVVEGAARVVATSAWSTAHAGAAATKGVEAPSVWLYPWVRQGSSGVTVQVSTQRTNPYALAGYDAVKRRLPCELRNTSGGDVRPFFNVDGGASRWTYWQSTQSLVTLGTELNYGAASALDMRDAAPPDAALLSFTVRTIQNNGAATNSTLFSGISLDGSTSFGGGTAGHAENTVHGAENRMWHHAPNVQGTRGVIWYKVGANGSCTVQLNGWRSAA